MSLDNVCNIILWSIVECGAGILAGSLPSLRMLLQSWIDKTSSNKGNSYRNTPGSGGASHALNRLRSSTLGKADPEGRTLTLKPRANTTFVSASRKGAEGTWIELEDDSSQKNMIHRTLQVSVEVS